MRASARTLFAALTLLFAVGCGGRIEGEAKGDVSAASQGGAGPSCPSWGWFCGASIGGDHTHLYYCPVSSSVSIDLGACGDNVCHVAPSGSPDFCDGGSSMTANTHVAAFGWWCGGGGTPLNDGSSNHLYFFDDGYPTDLGLCANGCQVNPAADACKSGGGPPPPSNTEFGVAVNGPGIYNGDPAGALHYAQMVAATGAVYTRVGFRLDRWKAPDDTTLQGGLTFYQAYDQIVDYLTTHGVQVYGDIGGESVPGGGDPNSDDYVNRYTSSFVKIFDHFKDRVRVFETFNEPNNWRSGTNQPAVSPYYFAKMHQNIYLNAKFFGGRNKDPLNQAKIVSGAIFTFEGTDGSSYLNQVYQAGKSQLAWDWIHANTGSYPLDGFGLHIYVGQGPGRVGTVYGRMTNNLNGFWNAIAGWEGGGTSKRIWLSEFGWTIDQVSAAEQAGSLAAGFAALADFGRVAAGIWFTYQDFTNGRYGLVDGAGNPRPDYAAFVAARAKYAPHLDAMFVGDNVPAQLTAGSTTTVSVQVRNIGSQTWTEASHIRLAAAPGVPTAVVSNQLAFTPPTGGGYAKSVTDARVFLGAGVTVPPGATGTFTFDLAAPATPGNYQLGAIMIEESVAWFGDTLRHTVQVQ